MRGNDLEAFCGTASGYTAHQKRNEPACDECRAAHKRYRRQLRSQATPPPVDTMSELIDPDLDEPTAREPPGEWADIGACKDKPPEWFFPERGESTASAKAVCATCPVQAQCLEHAVRVGEKFGIWGGTSERQRRRMRKHARREPRGNAA